MSTMVMLARACLLSKVIAFMLIAGACNASNEHVSTYYLVPIPTFLVKLTLEQVVHSYSGAGSSDMHTYEKLQHYSESVKEGTVSYLFDYISQVLQQKGSTDSKSPLHAVELDVAFHQTTQGGEFIYHNHNGNNNNGNLRRTESSSSKSKDAYQYFSAEISGHIALHQTVISPSYTVTPSNLQQLIDEAFEEDYSLSQYTLSIQTHIPTLAFLTVTNSVNYMEVVPLSSSYDGKGSSTGSRRSEDVIVSSLLAIGLVVLFTGLYVFVSLEHRMRLQQRMGKRMAYDKGHLLIDTDDDDLDYEYTGDTHADIKEDTHYSEFRISNQCEDSCNPDEKEDQDYHATASNNDVGTFIQFIPVPARKDELSLDGRAGADSRSRQSQRNKVDAPTPRRYVQAISPFEVLYGAAFCHSEKDRVAVARGQSTQKHKRANSRRRRGTGASKGMKPLRTMTSITEEMIGKTMTEKEAHKDELNIETLSLSESFFPQMFNSLSSYLQEKKVSRQAVPLEEDREEKYGPDITSLGVEEGVVYRDFPRHDGTPCVMFTSIDESDWNANNIKPLDKTRPTDGDDNEQDNSSHCSQSQSSTNSHTHSDIDNFVDRLENLIASRSRQYQERVKMDNELTERRQKALERRQKEEEQSISGSSSERDNVEEKRLSIDAERKALSPSDDLGDTCSTTMTDKNMNRLTDKQISPREVEALCFEEEGGNSPEEQGRNESEIVRIERR